MVTWDLEDIYKVEDKDKLQIELKEVVNNLISKKDSLKPEISSEDFIELIKIKENLITISGKLSVKIYLKHCEDVLNKEVLKEMQELDIILTNYQNELIFFSQFVKDLDETNANRLQSELGKYKYYFESIRKSIPHMRSLEEEKIINLKDLSGESTLSTLRSLITGKFEFEFNNKTMNESLLSPFVMNEDETKRTEAYKILLTKYKDNQDTLGEIYKGLALDWYSETKDIRNYKYSISSRNFSNTLPDKTVTMLLNLIREKRTIFQEYFKLKNKTLNIKHSRYNTYAPYILKDKKTYDYETSKQIVLDTYKNFSNITEEFSKTIFNNNHVHSDITKAKRGGAFCYSFNKNTIPYILLNHNNDLNSLLTMAHEFGHGIHGQLAKDKTQMTYHSPLAIAETASIFGEMLLTDHLKKTASDEEKRYLLFHHIDGMFASILRQAYFVIFEQEAHEKISKGTSTEELSQLYFKLLKEQFGDDMEMPEEFAYEWLRIPHIYESPFYCYAYAFGNLLVLALYAKYEKEGTPFVDEYLNILKAGGDADIKDILEKANINVDDKSFWEGAFDKLEDEITQLKTLLND